MHINFTCFTWTPKNLKYLTMHVFTYCNTSNDCTPGHHQMVNIEIRLIILFAAKDGDAIYSQ